jgi:hypothetical protein
MTTVFIGGSRRIARLNEAVKSHINNIIRQRMKVLIGDANGIDKAMQQYFADNAYDNVVVYCMEGNCRNNIGNWPVERIVANYNKRDFAYYATKDLEMARGASCGFMIWDGKSRGTLNNVLNLLHLQKKVLIYFSIDKACHTIKSLNDLRRLLDMCEEAHRLKFEEKLLKAQWSTEEEYLFSQQKEHTYLSDYSKETASLAPLSMGWLLGVGAKL